VIFAKHPVNFPGAISFYLHFAHVIATDQMQSDFFFGVHP
jgi:hypothetical protein